MLQDPALMEQRLEMMLRAVKELRVQKEAGSSATPSPSSAPPQQGQQHLQAATPSPVSGGSALPSSPEQPPASIPKVAPPATCSPTEAATPSPVSPDVIMEPPGAGNLLVPAPTPSTTFFPSPPPQQVPPQVPPQASQQTAPPPAVAPATPAMAGQPEPPARAACETAKVPPPRINSNTHAGDYKNLQRFAEKDCNANTELAKAWMTFACKYAHISFALALGCFRIV